MHKPCHSTKKGLQRPESSRLGPFFRAPTAFAKGFWPNFGAEGCGFGAEKVFQKEGGGVGYPQNWRQKRGPIGSLAARRGVRRFGALLGFQWGRERHTGEKMG